MIVRLTCTDRHKHEPTVVYRYDGPVPVPDGFRFGAPNAMLDLPCERCPRNPRPGDQLLRQMVEYAARHGDTDISLLTL